MMVGRWGRSGEVVIIWVERCWLESSEMEDGVIRMEFGREGSVG